MKLPFEGFSFVQLAHAVVANVSRAPSSLPSVPLLPFLSPLYHDLGILLGNLWSWLCKGQVEVRRERNSDRSLVVEAGEEAGSCLLERTDSSVARLY